MANPSAKRAALLRQDEHYVRGLHKAAIAYFGEERVKYNLTTLWDVRCMWGIKGILPFGAMESKSLGDVLYVAREVCGFTQEPRPTKTKKGS